MRERDWQLTVEDAARRYQWLPYHSPDVKVRRERGFPDLVLLKAPRVIFAELKRDGSYPTPEQRVWLAGLSQAGQECAVWWPRDLPEILRCLGPAAQPAELPVRYRTVPAALKLPGYKDLPRWLATT